MFDFITKRPLWVNILVGILLGVVIFMLVLSSLGLVTRHNKTAVVPNVQGLNFEEAEKLLSKNGFRVDVLDSVYTDTAAAFAVIKQIPAANEVVKTKRTVYLTVNRAVIPTIEMPNLVGYSFRNAEMTINGSGLKVGDTIYRPDFAKNSVLEQRFNGQVIAAGAEVPLGAKISLVLGSGVSESTFQVPNIVGMRYADAKEKIEALGLSFLSIIAPGIRDTANAYIYRQNPERLDENGRLLMIRGGQTMDIWLQSYPVEEKTTSTEEEYEPEI